MPSSNPRWCFWEGAGSLLRYWAGGLVQHWSGDGFPVGTLVINVSGCLVMGFLMTAWYGPVLVRDEVRALVLIGVLGGYTTFSAFGRDSLLLAQQGEWVRAALYVLASVLLSLAAVWLGALVARGVYGPSQA